MKLLLAAAAGAAMLAGAGSASAQMANMFGPASAYATLGYSNLSANETDSLQFDLATVRGGVRLGQYIGLEAEYSTGINSEDEGGVQIDVDSQYAGYLIGFVPAGPNVEFFGRVGMGKIEGTASLGNVSESDDAKTTNYGLGVQGFFPKYPNIGVRAEYTRLDNRDDEFDSPNGDSDMWSLSLVWRFR